MDIHRIDLNEQAPFLLNSLLGPSINRPSTKVQWFQKKSKNSADDQGSK